MSASAAALPPTCHRGISRHANAAPSATSAIKRLAKIGLLSARSFGFAINPVYRDLSMPSLRTLLPVRNAVVRARIWWWNRFWGMDIHPTARISLSAKLDKTNPGGIHIGEFTAVTFRVSILAHDMSRRFRADTVIGANCFIGAHSIILPGVTIGDGSIVAAGSVVNRDVPANSIVAGNPAKVIRSDIETTKFGVLKEHLPPLP